MSNVSSKAQLEVIEQPFGYSIRIKEGKGRFTYYDFKNGRLKEELKGKITKKIILENKDSLINNKKYFNITKAEVM
jgi:hypothetical protein